MRTALIDADIVCYRAAYARQNDPTWAAVGTAGDILGGILYDCFFPEDYTLGENAFLYLTGSGNFRYELATIKPYKGHRGEKPKHLKDIRDYMVNEWGAVVIEGEEADDAIAKKATELNGDCVIVSVDKDFLQVPATHYDFVKGKWSAVNKEEGDRFFYTQLLTGDTADNIQGVPGIGPKKAEKAYEGLTTEEEFYKVALEAYKGDTDALIENARLLWLRRYDEQMWEPPKLPCDDVCPEPWRKGVHEDYLKPDGTVYCRACGRIC